MTKLDKMLETISRGYNYPLEWVKKAYKGGLQTMDDIIDYCEAMKEIREIEEKKNENQSSN